MPNHEEHCEESRRRYGKSLHRWMDEPSLMMGTDHRMYRHSPYKTPIEARKMFGENADNVCLDHIRLDELKTGEKWHRRKRKNPFDYIPKIPKIRSRFSKYRKRYF